VTVAALIPGRYCTVYLASREDKSNRVLKEEQRARGLSVVRPHIRYVLCGHFGCHPHELLFATRPGRKPYIISPPKMAFSVSHSGPLTAVAVMRGEHLGVDVEQERIVPDLDQIAAIALSQEERDFLGQAKSSKRHLRFLSLWVRKEAYLKAVGLGLSGDASRIKVASDAGWLRRTGHPDLPIELFVTGFRYHNFCGAIAAEWPVWPELQPV
jgi:phosphopantetheinyl transferase